MLTDNISKVPILNLGGNKCPRGALASKLKLVANSIEERELNLIINKMQKKGESSPSSPIDKDQITFAPTQMLALYSGNNQKSGKVAPAKTSR